MHNKQKSVQKLKLTVGRRTINWLTVPSACLRRTACSDEKNCQSQKNSQNVSYNYNIDIQKYDTLCATARLDEIPEVT